MNMYREERYKMIESDKLAKFTTKVTKIKEATNGEVRIEI